MLVAQAVYASRLFLGKNIDDVKENEIEEAYDIILAQKQNAVLVGMPSSGKSTIGKRVARALSREFVDTDEEIVKRINMPIAEFFKEHSEGEFRAIESEVMREVSKKSAVVIATGGGVVLAKDNVYALKRNGKIVFLDRKPENLVATKSRPLASNKDDLAKLYEKRYPIYTACADQRIVNDKSVGEIAMQIAKEFQQ